jgi:hypothetical protein
VKGPKAPGSAFCLDGLDVVVNPSIRHWAPFILDPETSQKALDCHSFDGRENEGESEKIATLKMSRSISIPV